MKACLGGCGAELTGDIVRCYPCVDEALAEWKTGKVVKKERAKEPVELPPAIDMFGRKDEVEKAKRKKKKAKT